MRQALDHYRTLVIGGIYSCDEKITAESLRDVFFRALKHCISVHPILSAVILGEETEAPVFARPRTLDLNNHISTFETGSGGKGKGEQDLIKSAFIHTHDQPFNARDRIPPWKIVVVPLPSPVETSSKRYLILFGYYHSHGDGKSGLAFHKSFVRGLSLASDLDCRFTTDSIHETPDTPLLPPVEKAGRLTISWSYLLTPVLGAYLPSFIAKPLNFRASATPESHDQWRGNPTSYNPDDFRTCVEMLVVDNLELQKILTACRERGAKFTGLFHQFIVRALSEALPEDGKAGSFVSQTAVDLRHLLNGITSDDMALIPTGYYELFPRRQADAWKGWTVSGRENPIWEAAIATTNGLAKCASTLHDQPIGLLGYLTNFHSWTKAKIGELRDSSYELSNILSFNPGPTRPEDVWHVDTMLFSQPANASGSCVNFNTVSRDGGDMVLMLSWQSGVLGLDDEQDFAARVCASIRTSIDELCAA